MPNQKRTVEKTKKKKEVKHSLAFIMNEYGLSKSIVEKNFPEPELARKAPINININAPLLYSQ